MYLGIGVLKYMNQEETMNNMLNISEGTSLAFHGLAMIAKRSPERINVKYIAETLSSSEAHLAKVFQKLAKADIVSSVRGPAGGFILSRPAEEITFLQIYEILESPVSFTACPLSKEKCPFDKCIFDGKLSGVTRELYDLFKSIRLSDFIENTNQEEGDLLP